MPTITGTDTGGLSILSYKLEWNSGGSGDTFTPIVGDVLNNMDQVQTVGSLTTGNIYKFRYAVKNEVGWSDYSDVLITYAATAPQQLTSPTTTIDSTTVKISWID